MHHQAVVLVIFGGFVAMTVIGHVINHRIPENAPFKAETVCLSHDGNKYSLSMGVLPFQHWVAPKNGFVICDETGVLYSSTVRLKYGKTYKVFKASATKPSGRQVQPVCLILAR